MFRAHSPYSSFFTSGLLSAYRADAATDQPALYLDVEFSDDDQYFSFLSLDLAETQSTRSLSLVRKQSRSSRRSRPKCHPVSLRAQPSPKPVPSMTLPSPPPPAAQSPVFEAPPRLPSLPPLPSLELDLSSSKTQTPCSHMPARRPSTVSTRTRLRNRATALALLEGRQKPVVSPSPRPRELKNFMSMSDDEDEDDSEDDVLPRSDSEDDPFNPTLEPEDIVLPASPATPSFPPTCVLPHPNRDNLSGRKPSQRRVKQKSIMTSEWFPLKSFIDLYNDNDEMSPNPNWNWRSFIQVSSVA